VAAVQLVAVAVAPTVHLVVSVVAAVRLVLVAAEVNQELHKVPVVLVVLAAWYSVSTIKRII
jgi:hypothetical protein